MKKTITFFCRTYAQLVASYMNLKNRYKSVSLKMKATGGGYYQGSFTTR